ncbi:MAG TPA: ABC transporter ATP-binding protein [Geminicoccaceae bacterium]|nr:ABC transporter ATP-binding protein [Geminicoccaceae bacterium]
MVRLTGVSRCFGATLAVEDVSLELEAGAFLTILGPSGCGKTTLLRMVAGFISPTAGEIEVHGRPVAALAPWRRRIGMVFQRLALFPHLTAFDNVAYPLRMRGSCPRAEIGPRVERYLDLVRLRGLGDRRPHELSGGQQQRVAIARALVFEPDLLLLDEPLAALDRKLREDMQLEFRRIQRELGVTTINVTHDQREALVMSDRVLVMDRGRVQQAATPLETYAHPANRFVAGFLGLTNFLRGEIVAPGRVRIGGTEIDAPRGEAGLTAGQPVEVAIRAERIAIDGGDQRFAAEIADVVFEGDRTVYEVRVPSLGCSVLRLFELDPSDHPRHGTGETLTIGWSARDLLVFAA